MPPTAPAGRATASGGTVATIPPGALAGRGRPGPETVLGKTMSVLLAFTIEDAALSFTDLQSRTGLAKATCHRLLADVTAAGLLDRTADGRYRLSSLVFELGMRASVERTLLEVAIPFLEDLYERTHETVHLGVREGHEVVYVAKLGGHRQAAAPSRLGGRMPLHATALGKALLAWAEPDLQAQVLEGPLRRCAPRTIVNRVVLRDQLAAIVARGIAYEYEESAVGIGCVAAAVLDTSDQPIAAISATGPLTRFTPERHTHAVRAAAAGVAATLGRRAVMLDR